ncbi:MAG: DEAD/DEAH box helicase, partial [Actinobacteria bacterium]|nr:DEAD/DEAH box helicase [Actinomycetota bacterium]
MSRTGYAHVTVAELGMGVGPLVRELSENQRAVIVAPPGVGKTTKLPLMMLEAADSGAFTLNGTILLLEPRRVAAVAAARFMAQQLGERVGETVGYQIRGERSSGPLTRIVVVTERLLVRRLQRDPELAGVGAVIFDEVHERSLSTDLGLALLLDATSALREDLHIVAMSATPDVDALADALKRDERPVTVVAVTGAAHEVTTHYVGRDHRRELEDEVSDIVAQALGDNRSGDVLVFLPGRREIRRTAERLARRSISTLTLWGGSDRDGAEVALAPASPSHRRVILSTSVAQTSLTIDGVRIVVDAGLERLAVYDRHRRVEALVT